MIADVRIRLRALFRRDLVDADLDEELRAHLDALIHKHERAGQPPAEAARLARLEFGGVERIRDDCRDARGVTLVETIAHDLRYATRVLRKDASFGLIA